MAETFLFSITENVLSNVSSIALQQIASVWNIESEVTKLQSTLSTIKAVILDADEQQSKNHEVRDWLDKLKDAVYDIADLLDDLSMQVSRSESEVLVLKKVTRFFSRSNPFVSRFKIVHRVKVLRKRLDEIAADRNNFHFIEQGSLIPLDSDRVREQTHSFVRASDIIGRESDRENIVQLLLSSHHDDNEEVVVIPIVGIGGLGKTTVVKLAYNDDRVMRSFDLGMWVSVSEDFSVGKVVEKILKSATGGESHDHLDMDQMQRVLAGVLSDKKYLLVLDDVWNEDRNKWMDLRELLLNCRPASKIIVTTRSKAVATITSTVPAYNLTGLSDDDCLSLFLKCAFRGSEDWNPSLVEIGKEIVKKCGGVPLAVKTLGSLLYMNTDEQEWLRIRDNDIWEIDQKKSDILPLLRLSYERLPSYLRQCFAYCSILPKGLEIPREMFINLWIAQDFVHSENENRQLDEVANQYFNELLSRFCFQEVVEAFDGEILACKIHNLVHDLARSVAGRECLSVKPDAKSISDRFRHLYFEDFQRTPNKALLKLKDLRSLRCAFKIKYFEKPFFLRNFMRLRVLIMNSSELEELPSSIGRLKKLRYLDMSQNSKIKTLPKAICKLVNLQTLNLINCESLQELPERFGDLISLKTLYLTTQRISLRKMGQSFTSSLQFLLLFNCDFVQLPSDVFEPLTSIKVLRIYDCPRLSSLPNSIKHLSTLEKLWIWNCEELDLSEGEGLTGLTGLRSLLFMGLPKLINLPVGLKQNVAKTLKFFRIANCQNLTALPEWIMEFTLLQKLYIEDCPDLWFLPEGVHDHVVKLHISGCPRL